MAIKLNHTIVHARDKRASATFFAELFGLPKPVAFGPFLDIEVANEVTLAFLETDDEIQAQHYAFLVSEREFDQIFGRIKERRLAYWAIPDKTVAATRRSCAQAYPPLYTTKKPASRGLSSGRQSL